MQVIRANQRYHFEARWLSTYWHFSFDHYYDPDNVSFGPLRVFNDDLIRPGGGFPMHEHREMEIITYVLQGRLEHRDDLGNVGVIGPSEVQRMSAGTGVRHSEYNASQELPVRLLQLWIVPAVKGLRPSWEQKSFARDQWAGRLFPVAVPAGRAEEGRDSAVRIHQDATIYVSLLRPGDSVTHRWADGRRAYLFVAEGEVRANAEVLRAGDQTRITGESWLELSVPPSAPAAHLLLLDLP